MTFNHFLLFSVSHKIFRQFYRILVGLDQKCIRSSHGTGETRLCLLPPFLLLALFLPSTINILLHMSRAQQRYVKFQLSSVAFIFIESVTTRKSVCYVDIFFQTYKKYKAAKKALQRMQMEGEEKADADDLPTVCFVLWWSV